MHYRAILSINHIISLIPYAHGAIKPYIAISPGRPPPPSYFTRMAIGPYIIGIMVLFTILAYFLKTAYWFDLKKKRSNAHTTG